MKRPLHFNLFIAEGIIKHVCYCFHTFFFFFLLSMEPLLYRLRRHESETYLKLKFFMECLNEQFCSIFYVKNDTTNLFNQRVGIGKNIVERK